MRQRRCQRHGAKQAPSSGSRRSTPAIAASRAWSLVPFNLSWYHVSVALNIKDPETERLAAEVAALTGTTKTGAVRYALRQVLKAQSHGSVRQREERLTRFLEEEIWPLVPPDQLGKPVSKAEREEILGFGEHGA
jgi:antitoxin VapB